MDRNVKPFKQSPLPNIRTLPLPEETQMLFSRAVRLAQQPQVAEPVRPWLERHYSDEAVYRRLLPEMQRTWESDHRHLTAAPTKGELDWWDSNAAAISACSFKEHLAQDDTKHPGYRKAIADRRARLKSLEDEQQNWRPSVVERLRLAVDDLVTAEYPDGTEHVEHSRKVVAVAALLMPEPVPMLGELGDRPFASRLHLTAKKTGDWLADLLAADATAATTRPHGYRPTVLDMRDVGREEVMFVRNPGEARTIQQGFPLDALVGLLRVATDELESLQPSTPAGAYNAKSPATPRRNGGGDPRLNDTDKRALEYIRQNPGCKGDAVAAAASVTPEHFRSRIWPKLKAVGCYNDDGYRPPRRSRKRHP